MQNRKATVIEVVQYRVTGTYALCLYRPTRRGADKPVHIVQLLEYEATEIVVKLGLEIQIRHVTEKKDGTTQ